MNPILSLSIFTYVLFIQVIMSKGLRFAIVGCGKIAPRHAEEMIKYGSLAAVCDIIPARAKKMAETYGAIAYNDIDTLIATETTPDIIAVCTPNGLHAEHSIKSLKAGAHVLCEKPLSIS